MSSARPESSRRIDEAAALWVARLDRGQLPDEQQRELEVWLAGDSRRRGAFAKANSVMVHADIIGEFATERAGAAPSPGVSRRRLFLGGTAIAASIGAAFALPRLMAVHPLLLRSVKGEIRQLPLSDGSSVTLNTNSVLQVAYSPTRRDVSLVTGEALFYVAKDRRRPFIVRAGKTVIRAVGTSFSVRLDNAGAVRVLVSEGVVEVSHEGQAHPVRAGANVMATVPSSIENAGPVIEVATLAVGPQEIARGLAWRDGMLSFDGQSLAEAAAEFDRYSATRIIVDDPALGRKTLTGLFSASDPIGFAKAVASALDGKVSQSLDGVHISR